MFWGYKNNYKQRSNNHNHNSIYIAAFYFSAEVLFSSLLNLSANKRDSLFNFKTHFESAAAVDLCQIFWNNFLNNRQYFLQFEL